MLKDYSKDTQIIINCIAKMAAEGRELPGGVANILAQMPQAAQDEVLMAVTEILAEAKHESDDPSMNHYDDLMAEHGPELEAAEARHGAAAGW